jgi:hypothetical protein
MRKKLDLNRNETEIEVWMLRQGITVGRIAEQLQVSASLVSQTIKGGKNNRRVLRCLLEAGCPRDILGLPDDLLSAA